MTYVFKTGERVQIPAYTDMWMRGARFGTVTAWLPARGEPNAQGVKANLVRVKLDKWPRPLRFVADDVTPIQE